MMNYIKIKLEFEHCEKGRFFRTFLVNPELDLVDFGCAIVTAIHGAFEHCFYFENKEKTFNPRAFFEDYCSEKDVLMNNYTVEDLGKKFKFCYDTGDGWDFNGTCTDTNEMVKYKDIVLIDGAGLGIWEDNIGTLYAYFEGEVDPNSLETNEEQGFYPPWNMKLKKYSDFDTAFDLQKQINRFNRNYRNDILTYVTGENNYFGIIDKQFDYDKVLFNQEEYKNIINDVILLIECDSIVKDVYMELNNKHDVLEATQLIAKEYIYEKLRMANSNKVFNVNSFYKALRKLL